MDSSGARQWVYVNNCAAYLWGGAQLWLCHMSVMASALSRIKIVAVDLQAWMINKK